MGMDRRARILGIARVLRLVTVRRAKTLVIVHRVLRLVIARLAKTLEATVHRGRRMEMGRRARISGIARVLRLVIARLGKQKPPAALIEHYRAAGILTEIDGQQSLDAVTAALLEAIRPR